MKHGILHFALCTSALSALAAASAESARTTIHFRAADAAEPIKWSGGTWDETGAPEGALLTDNVGWWGRSVFTGVSYTFAEPPAYTGDPHFRRLLDGHGRNPRLRRVGIGGGRPLVATFDFKRPCVFNEVDLMAAETTNAAARAEVSADGTNWTAFAEASGAGFLTRLRPDAPACGRYLRVTFRSLSSDVTLLDEVMAWGEGEVSGEYPENIRPIPRGNALRMASATNGVVEIVPIADPTAKSRQVFGHPKFTLAPADVDDGEILMARNETETRYFAVANGTTGTVSTTLSSPDFGQGVKAELRIGGLVRTQKPKIALTEQQKFDMLITGDEPANAFDHGRVGILPFFNSGNVPQENFARKYLANPEQVAGFPGHVVIAPGECAVVMLRITTVGAEPGAYAGTLCASESLESLEGRKSKVTDRDNSSLADGARRAPSARAVTVRVVDATLPDDPAWIHIWAQFTRQFPYESATRYENDVRAFLDLGATVFDSLPWKGSKVDWASRSRRDAMRFRAHVISDRLDGLIYRGKLSALDNQGRVEISNALARVRAKAVSCGVRPGQIELVTGDEPGPRNAKITGEICRFIHETAPDMDIYLNPSFWMGKAFAPIERVIADLGGFYTDCVGVSVPYRSIAESAEGRRMLWSTKRHVNAQYAHPAHRAGRSLSWSSFLYGFDGYAWWCYCWDATGTPWDIRTWTDFDYEAVTVFPLENDVAITAIYEEMREAWEDWRLLSLLRATGKATVLDALLREFAGSIDPPNMENAKPYACDFQSLRDRALAAFGTDQ